MRAWVLRPVIEELVRWRWVAPRSRRELNYDPYTGEPLDEEGRERWWRYFYPGKPGEEVKR